MTTTTGPKRADVDLVDLAVFREPETLDRLEKLSRAAVQQSETGAGIADLTTGTVTPSPVRLIKETAESAVAVDDADGGVFEQLDEDQEDQEDQGPALRRIIPETLLAPAVWRHRRAVWANAILFHSTRSPVYLYRAGWTAALGAKVSARDSWSYLFATEYGEIADKVRRKDAGPEHIADLRDDRRHKGKSRRKEPLTVWAMTGCSSYAAALIALGQAWGLVLASPALLPVVGVLYALGHREMIRRTDGAFAITSGPGIENGAPLGAESIDAAFRRAGLMKDDDEVTLVGPVRAVEINAAEAVIDLPGDLTVSTLVKHREKLAAAFRVEPTWLDFRSAGHPGRCRLWVASADPFGAGRTSPLLANPQRTDVWNIGIPFGYNRRGETVYVKLRHVMALLGGMTRTGKGMLLRNLICGLGLDPRVRIRLAAGAKPGEHRGYAPICSTFFGRRPERLVALLDALLAEAYRREEYLEEEGRAKLGEADLDRFPLELLIIDEAKQYLLKGAPFAERIAEQLEELGAFAAALNITVLLSTQDPDANTVPRGFKSNSGARIATRTGGPTQTNAILKEGATGAGLRAHDIPEELKGGAIVDLDGVPGELVRSYFIEDEDFDGAAPLIEAAVALRTALGAAPGQYEDPIELFLAEATGKSSIAGGPTGSGRPGEIEPGAVGRVEEGILAELLAVFAAEDNPERLPTSALLAGLAEIAPDVWSPAALAVDKDDHGAYVRTGGTELRKALDRALDGTGRTLAAKGWTSGGRANGFYLADVRTAAGIA